MAMAELPPPPPASPPSPSPSSPSPPRPLRCAHCEVSIASLFCEQESLAYCSPCSSSLHSRKARAHHTLAPLRLCDQCELSLAAWTCSLCAGPGAAPPLAFCSPCSSDLHSRKARSHHELARISISGKAVAASIPPSDPPRGVPCSLSSVGLSQTDLRRSRETFDRRNETDLAGNDENYGDTGVRLRSCRLRQASKDQSSVGDSLHESKSKKPRCDQEFRKPKEEEEEEEEIREGRRKPLMEYQPLAVQDLKKKKKKGEEREKGKMKAKTDDKDENGKETKKCQEQSKKMEEKENMEVEMKVNKEKKKKKNGKEEHWHNETKQENASEPMKKSALIVPNQEIIDLSDDDSNSESEYCGNHKKKKEIKEEAKENGEEDVKNKSKDSNLENKTLNGANPNSRLLRNDDLSSESEHGYGHIKGGGVKNEVNENNAENVKKKGIDSNRENGSKRNGRVVRHGQNPCTHGDNGENPNSRVLRNGPNRCSHDNDRENPSSRVLRNGQNRCYYDESSSDNGDEMMSEIESESDQDTSGDDETYGTKKYRKGSVTLEAFVVKVEAEEEGQIRKGACEENQAEEGVQGRIRKMLELGLHPDTPDFEAQQALKNAQRLLTKHNLQQADVLKGGLVGEKNVFEGGMRIVELRSKDKKHPGCVAHWLYSLARTVADYFDVQYFVQKQSTIQIVFYGIKQNVECAAYAFAATFNRISKLSADFIPTKMMNSGQCKVSESRSSHSVHSRVSRMSYRTGLVEGLFEAVKALKKQDRIKKKTTNGKQEKNGELEYTKGSQRKEDPRCDSAEGEEAFPLCSEDSDDENAKKPHGSSSEEWEEENSSAITALVVHSKKVAEDFLKEKKVKVRIRKQSTPIIWDGEAFRKGKWDSKTIDIGQKALKGSHTNAKPKKRAR